MQVIFDPKAIDFLEKLPIRVRERIFARIAASKDDPHHYFKHLQERSEYTLRVGDYRVIAEMEARTIRILLVGHRKNVYDV